MKKLLFISLAMLTPGLSAAYWTFCDNCCNLPNDKTRYVNWTNNKMFVDSGPIKGSVDFNSSLLLGNGGTTPVTTAGLNALMNQPRVMDFENTPEWNVTFVDILGVPVPVWTFSHWNVQSFGYFTLHDADVTPSMVEFRTRAGGWAVDPLRLPYPPNCAADEGEGDAVDWWWQPYCWGTPNRSASLEIATSLGAVSFRYEHEPSGFCWGIAVIGGE